MAGLGAVVTQPMHLHPRDILLGAQARTGVLPVCDHYSGVEARMRKSLQLQAEMTEEFGACVFDVTLDCEDGAPVGGEAEHAALVVALALLARHQARASRCVFIRWTIPPSSSDIATIAGQAGATLCHIMVPKVESRAGRGAGLRGAGRSRCRPVAAARADRVAGRGSPRLRHRRASARAVAQLRPDGFRLGAWRRDSRRRHGRRRASSRIPLVVRAKLEIASACHAHGKVPSHCVVTEFKDTNALRAERRRRAAREFGYTRMWSIHPDQIRPILEAFAPSAHEIDTARKFITAAARADWAPISFEGKLEDRASYRYYWQVLERAHRTGRQLPARGAGLVLARRHLNSNDETTSMKTLLAAAA